VDAVLEFRAQDVNEAGEKLVHALPARIQGDAIVKGVLDAAPAGMPDELNVLHVKSADERDDAHTLLPNMVKTVHRYRTETLDGAAGPDAPDLKVVVIGHSHHARIVHDEPAGLLLVDTGAWIESFSAPGVPKTPNRQLGAICGGDFRVYQLDPKV
jgi:hypothetical protein